MFAMFSDGDEIDAALSAGEPVLRCTSPDLERVTVCALPLHVAGWATSRAGIETVRVAVDGNPPVDAVSGLVRPELRDRFGDAIAADSGFAIRLGPDLCPPGRRELTIAATTRDGHVVEVSGTVDCRIDVPAKVSPEGEIAPLPEVSEEEEEAALVAAEQLLPAVHRYDGVGPDRHARYAWAASLVDGRSVLDVACGGGWGTALLGEHATRAVGIDISPRMVTASAREHGDRAEFRAADVQQLPFADGEFDMAVCFEAIERVPDIGAALAELRRVLGADGLLLISAANRDVYPPGNPFHLHELTPDELRAAVGAHFANVAVHRQHTHFASLLADDTAMRADDPSRDLAAAVAKIVATPLGDELYAVVAASDGELPAPPARLVLGPAVDHDEQRRLLASWQQRAVSAELEVTALRNEIEFVCGQQEATLWRASRDSPKPP